MKHILLITLVLCAILNTHAQATFTLPERDFKPSNERSQDIIRLLERESRFKTLTSEEKEFYYWVNLLRKNPSSFFSAQIKPFLDTFPELLGRESQSLEKDLLHSESLPFLLFSNDLREAAMEHALDLAKNANRLSHESSRGMGFPTRMKSNGINRCAAENLYQGNNDALFALMMLLLDMGMEVPGHRRNLLNPNYRLMGVSIQLHKSKQYHILVQDFSCL